MQPYPSLSHCDAASRDTEEGRRTRWCRRESACNQSAQSRHAALSCTTMWQPRRKRRPGGIRYGREARRTHCTLPWLLQRIGCWGRVWSPPLPAPVALFQLFPCGRRWHSQNPITPSFRLLSMAPQFKSQRTPCLGLPVCPPLDPHKSSPSRTKVYLS